LSVVKGIEELIIALIVLFVALQITVIVSSALSTRLRRRRESVILGQTAPVHATVEGNQVTVYTYGQDLYRDMLRDIDSATTCICLESFIWKSDAAGEAFKDAVIRKAREGVPVYVIFDAFANLVVPKVFKTFPEVVHVYPYRAWVHLWYLFDPRRWARDHRKLLVVDREIAYVGGYNIGSLYGTRWRDTHVRMQGSAARNLFALFVDFWDDHASVCCDLEKVTGSLHPHIHVTVNNPTRLMFPIRSMYIEAIDLAKHKVLLTTPYFIPDKIILASLYRAARRGVAVELIVPEQSNHLLADWLARTFFTGCLKEGIRIYLYQGAMIHAKTATIDEMWTTVGTANLDRLSLVGNHEINVEIFDSKVASAMESVFLHDRSNCRELQLEQWQRRPLAQKVGELILSPLWPFL